ncbi:uncharacterized protein B0H18DRAFT_952357 [Fomitopsis serialis]|uniref:uncharacterized protein n=1 Tax=Fomitopsis serialis TaxID=139415 RepID=UPI00200797F5|nr:uncharacterized protein B0H18DRAFT_952357 [Neoantrodia serialis]KAH9932205.1 hypothetical protein B0H18DRAFT_952357 [Neoantrodia serialis]
MKLALSSLILLFSIANALELDSPTSGWYPGDTVTVGWTSQSGDPASFSLTLVSADSNGEAFALAADVPTDEGSVSITVPDVAAGQYVLNAANVTNVNEIYAESAQFSVS